MSHIPILYLCVFYQNLSLNTYINNNEYWYISMDLSLHSVVLFQARSIGGGGGTMNIHRVGHKFLGYMERIAWNEIKRINSEIEVIYILSYPLSLHGLGTSWFFGEVLICFCVFFTPFFFCFSWFFGWVCPPPPPLSQTMLRACISSSSSCFSNNWESQYICVLKIHFFRDYFASNIKWNLKYIEMLRQTLESRRELITRKFKN